MGNFLNNASERRGEERRERIYSSIKFSVSQFLPVGRFRRNRKIKRRVRREWRLVQ